MSVNAVPGFKAIPRELLETPKPVLMTPAELNRVLNSLARAGFVRVIVVEDTVRYEPTAKGKRILEKSA